jgi:hypothetical protein
VSTAFGFSSSLSVVDEFREGSQQPGVHIGVYFIFLAKGLSSKTELGVSTLKASEVLSRDNLDSLQVRMKFLMITCMFNCND